MNLLSLPPQNKQRGWFQQLLKYPHMLHTLAPYINCTNFKGRDFLLAIVSFEGRKFRNSKFAVRLERLMRA
jgi:hypothetical protein